MLRLVDSFSTSYGNWSDGTNLTSLGNVANGNTVAGIGDRVPILGGEYNLDLVSVTSAPGQTHDISVTYGFGRDHY